MESGTDPALSRSILDYNAFDLANRVFDAYPEPAGLVDFGPYQIRGRIDKGGMGEVWRAYDYIARREVAIKVPRYLSDPALRRRFAAEVSNQAQLEHAFIARLYDHGICPDGTPYFAMEYVEGTPLDRYCVEKKLSLKQRIALFCSVCEAVQYAHGLLVLHRDLKPSNILVKDDGTPKLLDFGIAAKLEAADAPLRQTHTEVGFTRAFAAPEQFRRQPVGVYTDVYALGVILYQLLSGRLPYDLEDSTPGQAELMVTGDRDPETPSLAAQRSAAAVDAGKRDWNDLNVLCLKAMKKDIKQRYQTVFELSQDVNRYLNSEPLEARPDKLSYKLGKFVARNGAAVLGTILSLTLLFGLVAFFSLRLASARNSAEREAAITKAMNQFLSEDLLGQSDPSYSGRAKESFADAVNRAASHIDLQFKAQPLVAARLHQTIARAFDNRSEFPPARREYRRASDLFTQVDGPLSQDAIAVNLQHAAMEARSFEPGSPASAKALVSGAEATLSRVSKPRGDLAVWLLLACASIAIVDDNARTAGENFSEALREAQNGAFFDEAARAKIQQMVAFSYTRLGNGAKAEPLLRQVIAVFSRAEGPDSPTALRARVYLSQALMVQHKFGAAIQETNLLYPLLARALGEDHQVTVAVLGTRAASEGSLGLWDDAIRDDLAAYNVALRKQGPGSYLSIGMLSDAGLSQCRSGKLALGGANTRKAFEQSKSAYGERAGITGGAAYAFAVCLIGSGKLDQASELLGKIDVQSASQLSADATVAASVALAQGRIAAMKGDYVSAKRYADLTGSTFSSLDAAAGEKVDFEQLRRQIDSRKP